MRGIARYEVKIGRPSRHFLSDVAASRLMWASCAIVMAALVVEGVRATPQSSTDPTACQAGALASKAFCLQPLEVTPDRGQAGLGVFRPGSVFMRDMLLNKPEL